MGKRLDVPPTVKHGFALKKGEVCYFLTIQLPPTDRPGNDDYVEAEAISLP